MCAQAMGIPPRMYISSLSGHRHSALDTGAYASRQTYVTGKAIKRAGEIFRDKVLDYAAELTDLDQALDIRGRDVVSTVSGAPVLHGGPGDGGLLLSAALCPHHR